VSNLTREQLAELTERVNDRLLEFGPDLFDRPSPGVVRLMVEVFEEWLSEAKLSASKELCAPIVLDGAKPISIIRIPSPAVAVPEPVYTNGAPVATATVGVRTSVIPTTAELIAELKRQSMGGVMPTMAQFDLGRPAVWATAQAHLLRLELSWSALAELADLKPRKPGPLPGREANL
jgi:hypothetical protein